MEEQLLKDYVATYLNPKYNGDWDAVNSKFPELSGVDKQLLKDYVATYLNPKHNSDWNVVNSKFPELFPAGKSGAESPMAVQPKKKEATVSPFVAGGSGPTKFDPRTGQVVQDTPDFAKPGAVKPQAPQQPKPTETIMYGPMGAMGLQRTKEYKPEYEGKSIPKVVGELGKTFAKGVVKFPADVLETAAIATTAARNLAAKTGLVDESSATELRVQIGGANVNLFQAASEWKNLVNEFIPTDKDIESGFWGQTANALGQMVPVILTGGIAGGGRAIVKEAGKKGLSMQAVVNYGKDLISRMGSAQGVLAVSQVAAPSYEQAKRDGATENEAIGFSLQNAVMTLPLEMLPVNNLFKRLDNVLVGNKGVEVLKRAVVGGAEEGITEGIQNIYENVTADAIYGTTRGFLDGVGESTAVGGTVGAIMNGLLTTLLGRRARATSKMEIEQLDKSIEEVQQKVNQVDSNNKAIEKTINEIEETKPRKLSYGSADYNFLESKDGKLEYADDSLTEEQAKGVVSNLTNSYKKIDFTIEEVEPENPYQPTTYKIIGNPKTIQQDAIQEQAAGEVPVQPGTGVSQEVAQGIAQAEPQGVTQEGQVQEEVTPTQEEIFTLEDEPATTAQPQEQIAEEDIALSGLRDGFQSVTRNSFDVRSDADVMQKIGGKKSFATSVTRKGKKYLVVGLKLNQDVGETTSGRDGYSFATIEDNGNLPSNAVDLLTQKAVSNVSSIYPNIKEPTIDMFMPVEGKQEVVPASIQPEIDTIEAQRREELEANKAGLDKPYYLGETEGPTLGEFINQEYDAKIEDLKAKAVPQQVQEEVVPTQEELDLETQLAEDLNVIKSETKPRLRVEGIDIPAEEDINLETIEANLDKLPAYEVNFTTPEVSQDIQVNPIEESKSSTKEGSAESRTIESFQGVPMIVGMSDTLAAGTVVDSMGNPMSVEGGLLYNVLGKNKNAAWAGVTEEGARIQYNEALELYNNNKNLFDKLWAEGKLPNGHVPMAIMRMADTAVNSNEAVFRYLSPLVKSQPEANQQAALDALKGDIEIKKKVKQEATVKSANKLDQFISSKNINSLGQLLDAIVSDANSRAKGDTENTLSLSERSLLFDLMVSPKGTKAASKNTVNALFGAKKDPKSKAFLADNIYESIGEPAMLRIPRGNVAAVVGVDVLNGGVIPVEHGNYGFGPKGQMISLISNPKHGLDVFPEWKAKAVRVFKKTNPATGEGRLPTASAIADEVGGAFFIDSAFRNAKVSMEPSDIELLAAKLRFAFPDVTVSNSKEEFDRVLQEEGVRTKESNGKVILGMTKDGKVYLNPDSDSLATPIHEFGHIWIDFLRSEASKEKGDALLAKGLSLVEGTKALQQAIAKYGDNALAREEALVELMATKGEDIINKSKKKEFKNWLNALFKYVKEFFTTTEQLFKGKDFEKTLKDMSLDDFINIGLADLLKGKAISSEFKAKDASASSKARSSKAQRLAPNGKPSNLSEAQWNQVRTPEFKKWFGDWENDPENASKVVDENGEPLVMYHGSPSVDIESFDIDKGVRQKSGLREFANYFTSNKKLADLYRKSPLSKEYKNEIENLLREAKEKRSESRSNATWNFYTQEIDRLNSLFEGKIYEVFLNVKSPFEFNGGELDMKGWDNASLDIGYKTVSGKAGVIEALSGNNSAYKNTEYDGVIVTDLADMFYGTTDKNETKGAVKDLTGTVVAIWDAKQIKSATENVGTFDTGTSNIRFRVGDNVQSFINKARAQGYSEAAIKNVLTRSGVDTDAIDTALAKVEPAAKKVEVTEEFAPGYNRVLNNMFGEKGIVTKSRERGRSEEDTLENAINYLQKTKVYINATDVQREAMVRNLRKEFKKREKAAPSAEKVVGKPKKKEVTVDEMAALKDQIKLEARAAREAKGDLNTKRKAFAAKIIAARKKAVINAIQARALVNKISRVNLDNPIMVDRLVEYIDKVFDNANYAADMAELRKLQKQARSRNHTSMTNLVDQFTSINPEDIPLVDKETGEPLNKIMEYKEALDFLNTRTPFYGKMNEVFDEMLSYKVAEKFDAVKTKDALMDKYKSIMDNKLKILIKEDTVEEDSNLKNVEAYVALIKDINAFKRKAYQLLQNDAITQEEYNDLINGAGETQAVIEKRFATQIDKIKKDLIAEIKNQRPKVSRDFSNAENDLIRRYLEISDADLKSLSPEDLFVLNDLLENISNGEIDVSRFGPIVSKAYTSSGLDPLAKQINKSKFDKSSEEGRQELSEQESSFWEGLLGMGRAKAGALQKLIISPFNRAIGSYEKFSRDGLNEFLKLKKKYKIDKFDPLKNSKDMHKIGMLTTYLQEHMAQFDSKNKDVKDIGKRDWFKEILNSRAMRDNYSSGKPSVFKSIRLGKSELDIIKEIWDSLPKNKDGNVDPKAVYDSYMANDGKFFTKNQKGFFDDVMAYKAAEITPKQKFANELSGASFKEIPFHMMRVRLDKGKSQIAPTASSENNNVRITAGTGKERVSEKVGAVMTNFEKLFISGIEQTGRDYFLSNTLQDINNTLAGVKKIVGDNKIELINTISYTLSDALKFEFDKTKSNFIFRNLLSARAAQTLLRPIRTAVELGSTLVSYPVRAKTLSGYKSLFGEQGAMKKLLEFTDSPMLLRDNISKAIDINDGSIEPQSRFAKATNYLSGLPERTMMVTSWMPTFKSEFKTITGIDFDMKKFNDSSAYREKYGKAIRESSAAADAQTEKIIGPTTKAGQRREIRIAPRVLANIFGSEGTVSKNSATGQILGFFSNYPFRESTEFLNGFREAAEVLNDEGALSSLSQLQKPLGVALNVAAYSFLSSATYALSLMLLGDDDDEERGEDLLKALLTGEGLLEELKSNAISLAGSQYAAGGKALIQLAATILIESTDDEEQKAKYKKLLKDSVFIDPLPVDKALGFKGEEEIAGSIGKYIPQFIMAYARYTDLIGTKNELKEIYDKVESKGVDALTEDEGLKVLALNTAFNSAQLVLNLYGTSLPEYNYIKTYMKKLKEDAGVADVYKGEVPDKKSSKGGGIKAKTMNKTDLKRYNRELYDQLYGPNSPGYEVQQQVKAFEKQQREFEKETKDRIYGVKD